MALRGGINSLTTHRLTGWAWYSDDRDTPVSLVVTVDGEPVARLLANKRRKDLIKMGLGDGRHAFDLAFQPPLSADAAHVVEVRDEADGTHLKSSPRTLQPLTVLDATDRKTIRERLRAPATAEEILARLEFIEAEGSRLRQAYVDLASGAVQTQHRKGVARTDPAALLSVTEATAVPVRKPQALFIDKRLPAPDSDGGSAAVLSHVTALQSLGYEVSFAARGLDGDPAFLESRGVKVWRKPAVFTVEELLLRQAGHLDVIYLHRFETAALYARLAKQHQPKCCVIYSVADLKFLRLLRQAEVEGLPDLQARAVRLRADELATGWASDVVITHSNAEAAILARNMRPAKVHVALPAMAAERVRTPFAQRRGLAFIGAFGHAPNVDAATRFVHDILPGLHEDGRALPFRLAGSGMPQTLQTLDAPGLELVGFAPDLKDVFEGVRLTVAPMAYGAGIKVKVLASLAAGVPCIMSPAAAEGLNLPPLLSDQLIAEGPSMAGRIIALHEDETLNSACSEAGLEFIRREASLDSVAARLRAAIRSAA